MTKQPITALIKGLSELGYEQADIDAQVKAKLEKGTHEDDRQPVAPVAAVPDIVNRLDAAGDAWMAKSHEPEPEPDGDEYKADDDDDGDGKDGDGDGKDDEKMGKGGSADAGQGDGAFTPAMAGLVLAQAVEGVVGKRLGKLEKAFGKLDRVLSLVEKIGDMGYATLSVSRDLVMAKGETSTPTPVPVVAQTDPALTERIGKLEKALTDSLGRVEHVLRQPVGGWRGVVDMTDVQVIDAPGDQNDPAKMQKGSTQDVVRLVNTKLLERQQEALRKKDTAGVEAMHKAIGTLNLYPTQAEQIAAEHGIALTT